MTPSAKTVRLLRECRVIPEPGAHVYRVAGDHDRYTVVISPDFQSCSCPARGDCSHLTATRLLDSALRDETALGLADPNAYAARRAAA